MAGIPLVREYMRDPDKRIGETIKVFHTDVLGLYEVLNCYAVAYFVCENNSLSIRIEINLFEHLFCWHFNKIVYKIKEIDLNIRNN